MDLQVLVNENLALKLLDELPHFWPFDRGREKEMAEIPSSPATHRAIHLLFCDCGSQG